MSSVGLVLLSVGLFAIVACPVAIAAVVCGRLSLRTLPPDASQRRLARIGWITGVAGIVLSLAAFVVLALVIEEVGSWKDF